MREEMTKVWIVGAKGHVGSALARLLDCTEYELFETDIDEVDVTDRESVASFMRITRPDVIINCAGITDVETCEKNPDLAYHVNAIGARNLAIEADAHECKLIQISTDDVFANEKLIPHCEFDATEPCSVYGKSKLAGEQLVSSLSNRYAIVRSSWVYGIGRDYVNFVLDAAKKGGSLEAPINQVSSPTSASTLASVIKRLIDNDLYGIYHIVSKGSCSRYEFAKTILEFTGQSDALELIPTEGEGRIRPNYSVLDTMMLRLDQIEEPGDWKEELRKFLDDTGGNV